MFDPRTSTHGLRTLAVQRMEGLGEIPAGEIGQVRQVLDSDHSVTMAVDVKAGALQAREYLPLAPQGATRASLGASQEAGLKVP